MDSKTLKELEDFRKWLKDNYGIQEWLNYKGTLTEKLAIRYAKHVLESKWISVEDRDRLPEVDELVQVGHNKKNWVDTAELSQIGFWYNQRGSEIYPTHHRPLPEPPK